MVKMPIDIIPQCAIILTDPERRRKIKALFLIAKIKFNVSKIFRLSSNLKHGLPLCSVNMKKQRGFNRKEGEW